MYDVITLGEILVDFVAKDKNEAGFPILDGNPGGGPPNLGAACAKLGLKTGFIGKAGDDIFGKLLEENLRTHGISTEFLAMDPDHFTTLAFVSLDRTGERSFSFSRKHSADIMLSEKDLPKEAISQARAFHFSSVSMICEPSLSATLAAADLAVSTGDKIVSFDPNYRPKLWPSKALAKERIGLGIRKCNLLKISREELALIYGRGTAEAAYRLMDDYKNVKILYLTKGAEGVEAFKAEGSVAVKGFKVNSIDTTGAGDIFGGSAMYKLLELGRKPEELSLEELKDICIFACAAAAISTRKYGGMPSAPSLEETKEFLEANLKPNTSKCEHI